MLNVLLVEDEPDHVELVRAAWEAGCGWRIARHVESVTQALAALDSDPIDVVLLDLNLGETRGIETLRAVAANPPVPPIIVLTSLDDDELARDAIRSGADDYVPKTNLSTDLLGRTIRHALERNRLTQELKQTNQRLDDFASLAAHDLVAPLERITALVDLVDQQGERPPQDEVLDALRMVQGECHRLANLITALLRFARVGSKSVRFESTPLTGFVQQVIVGLAAQIKRTGARVEVGDLPTVPVDRNRCQLLFQNLIENGLKYQPPGNQPEVRITGEVESDHLRVWVRDNGVGVPVEHQARIFEPFRRLHGDEIAGSGLGLAHCARIVRDHGGVIGVESIPAQGSSFWFTIPTRR